jgi:hypothetical protein
VCNHKRAPTLALGLFLYLLLPGAFSLEAADTFSVAADAGPLLVTDGGAALYWRSGLSFDRAKQFSSHIALGQVISDLPWAEGSVFGALGTFVFDTPRFGLEFGFGFLQHGLFSSKTEAFTVHNNGAQLFFAGLGTPIRIGDWTLRPSLAYGSGAWDEGSLYWFFGRPKIPALVLGGLSLAYRERHELAFQYLHTDLDILDNDAGRLFDSRLDAYAAYYRFSLEISGLRLGGSLGAFHAEGSIDGSLTASNQHFAYFPYNYYNLNGSFSLQAGFAALDMRQAFPVFQYGVTVGAAHIFQGRGAADIHYKNKTLFGGKEVFDTMPLDVGGAGFAFILLDAGLHALRPGKQQKTHLSLGLQKLFALPWGYKQALSGASAAPGASGSSANGLLRTALLSGLSLYGRLSR